jgi:hypothetical protein
MLIADIKNKLTYSELVSEDFLTSSVFSTFKYLDDQYLEKFLNQAVNIKQKHLGIKIQKPIYDFWPWHPATPPSSKGAEPDVVIYSGEMAILIEAKNYSGKSGTGTATTTEGELGDSSRREIIDQLGREYIVGRNILMKSKYSQDKQIFSITDFVLIFLTRHNIFPYDEIEESLNSIAEMLPGERDKAAECIYWLNWQKTVPILRAVIESSKQGSFECKISQDLLEFLDRRDLGFFSGFTFLDMFEDLLFESYPEYIFYYKEYLRYWDFLDDVQWTDVNKNDNIFYSKLYPPYWDFLDRGLNFKLEKRIFYGGDSI